MVRHNGTAWQHGQSRQRKMAWQKHNNSKNGFSSGGHRGRAWHHGMVGVALGKHRHRRRMAAYQRRRNMNKNQTGNLAVVARVLGNVIENDRASSQHEISAYLSSGQYQQLANITLLAVVCCLFHMSCRLWRQTSSGDSYCGLTVAAVWYSGRDLWTADVIGIGGRWASSSNVSCLQRLCDIQRAAAA